MNLNEIATKFSKSKLSYSRIEKSSTQPSVRIDMVLRMCATLIVGGMPWTKTGATHYYVQLIFPDIIQSRVGCLWQVLSRKY